MNKTIVVLIVGLILGTALGYAYMSNQAAIEKQQMYQQGLQAGQQMAAEKTPLDISLSQGTGVFNVSANVSSDGSSTAVSVSDTLTITNNDNRSGTLVITLKNPKTNEEGIPSGLENAYFNVWAGNALVKKYLYTDAEYTSGYTIQIDANSVVTVTIGVDLEQAPAGTFTDGQSYTMELYVYQPDSGYVETLTYTVYT